METYLTAYR